MKKSVLAVSAALALCACIGAVGLVGCSKNSDPYSNMNPISEREFTSYLSTAVLQFSNKEIGLKVSSDDLGRYFDITLQTSSINNTTMVHGNVNIKFGKEEVRTCSGEIWLYNDILYIDDGKVQYKINYNTDSLYNKTDDQLRDSQVIMRYVESALDEADRGNDMSTAAQIYRLGGAEFVHFRKEENNNTYFKLTYGADNGLSIASGHLKFEFNNERKLQSFEILSSSRDIDDVEGVTEVKIRASSSTIKLPTNYQDWEYEFVN